MKATFQKLRAALKDSLADLSILSGDTVGPSNASWQDVAGTAAVNLRHLASLIDAARNGQCEPAIMFPSPSEVLETLNRCL